MTRLLTVESVGRILDLYDLDTPEHGPKEVSNALAISKSKAHALMSSMERIGLLRRIPGGRYRLGWRPLELERIVTATTPFRPAARAVAMTLARHCGETIHVAALDGGRVVYVDRVRGPRGVSIAASAVGATLPAHCSGVGKILLAHTDAVEIDAILDRHGLPKLTPKTITDRDALYAELHRARHDGVAYDREEVLPGLGCVAAPIRDRNGRVAAALSIAAPVQRLQHSEAAYRSVVVRATRAIVGRMRAVAPDTRTGVERLARTAI
jgi:DNA-binding IclR family transcriptional regulator